MFGAQFSFKSKFYSSIISNIVARDVTVWPGHPHLAGVSAIADHSVRTRRLMLRQWLGQEQVSLRAPVTFLRRARDEVADSSRFFVVDAH